MSKDSETQKDCNDSPANHRVQIDSASFPDQPENGSKRLPATLNNFTHVVESYNIKIRFNQMTKETEVDVPGLDVSPQNRHNITETHIENLMVLHGMPQANVARYLLAVADRHRYDPFADWIDSKAWDGTSRIADICSTITPTEDYPRALSRLLIEKWLLSIVAATFHGPGFHCRGILTLQGEQGKGKTSWFGKLVCTDLRNQAVKLGHGWDGGSKDARLSAISHRIVELGELEGSLRRELASLKSFATDRTDKIRAPYARRASEFPRTTVFGASVNADRFLNDATGNSRFWTISVSRIDYGHEIDMQQVFAELKVKYLAGEPWWLRPEEEAVLNGINTLHEVGSVIGEKIASELDVTRKTEPGLPKLRAIEVLEKIGIEKPTNAQAKEANAALRSLLGPSRRVGGFNYWEVPWKVQGKVYRLDGDF